MSPRTAFAPMIVLLATATAAAGPKVEKTPYESRDMGFKVTFPNAAEKPIEDTLTVEGKLLNLTTVKASVDGVVYSVTYTRLPAEIVDAGVTQDILGGVRDSMKATDGKLVSDDKTELKPEGGDEKVPGRSFHVEAKGNGVRARVYLRGARLYEVTVAGADKKLDADAVSAFFDSFRLIK